MRYHEICTEARAYNPQEDHTIWIDPQGRVHSLHREDGTHFSWIAEHFQELFPDMPPINVENPTDEESALVFGLPIDRGWVRLQNHYSSFNLHGTPEAIRRHFLAWYPTIAKIAQQDGEASGFIDYMKGDDITGRDAFRLPRDRHKLLDWVAGKRETISD
jgi:hypothetical protein